MIGDTGGIGKELTRVLMASSTNRTMLNVVDEDSVAAFFHQSRWVMENEPLHVVNATGMSVSSMIHKSDVAIAGWTLQVNVLANLLLLKHLRPLFKVLLPGSTFTMLGSVTVDLGTVGTGAYTASKAALRGLVKVAANEFSPFSRVNLLELGYSTMGMIKQVPIDQLPPVPMGRLATIDDIAVAVEYIISSSYLTGAVLKVNGGLAS